MPLGIGYIAAVLEKEGYRVKVLDLLIEKKSDEEILAVIKDFLPQVVGFTAVTPTVNSAFKLAAIVKKYDGEIITIIGGPHATALPEESLNNNMDYVVYGEGEETIVDLLANIDKPGNVKSILYRSDGKVMKTAVRPLIQNLDMLPYPARHLFPPVKSYRGQEALGSANPAGSIITSRGCPFSCKFCFKAVFGNRFRARSAESVLDEWEMLEKKYHVKEVAIVDDSFTTDINRVHAICDGIIKRGIKTRWTCPNGIRVDLGDYEMLAKMKKSGCYRVALGIESGSQRILDSIGKNITLERIEETVKNCRRAGIRTMGFFMLGNIGETRESMEATISFAKKIRVDYAQFLIAMPYPGSGLYDEISKKGRIFMKDWDQYGVYDGTASFECGEVTPGLLALMEQKARRNFYLSPDYILRQLLNPETYRYFPNRLGAAFAMLINHKR
jgi:radical SAM superfamily enzyme YgiQ (UPF0313 family)